MPLYKVVDIVRWLVFFQKRFPFQFLSKVLQVSGRNRKW